MWSELSLTEGTGSPRQPARRIISLEAAFIVSDILSDRDARSLTFGLENPLATPFWMAVNTGTSKDMRDNWCVGYSIRYTVGVWVGNFSGEPMWNVSGMSGAAPVWIDVMNFLNTKVGDSGRPSPHGLVKKQVHFPGGMEPPREEWFVPGTEPAAGNEAATRHDQRILYPQTGTVIALDPDIPPDRQIVFSISQYGAHEQSWVLDGKTLGEAGKYLSWVPVEGGYTLSIVEEEGKVVDSVEFEVRGFNSRGPASSNRTDEKGTHR